MDKNSNQIVARLSTIKDPVEKLIKFMGILNGELRKFDQTVRPVIVGGSAILFYTLGGHLTQDIDLVVSDKDRKLIKQVLESLGFDHTPGHRHWYHQGLDLALEMPSSELAGSLDRVTLIENQGSEIYLIGLEDLLIDRLCSAKHWKYERDEAQALSLLSFYASKLDWDYLIERAKAELVEDKLAELREKAKDIN